MAAERNLLSDMPHAVFELDRDSVCAGDDCESHRKLIEAYAFLDGARLAGELARGYLPSVNGAGHWWECVLNGETVARVFPDGRAEKAGAVSYAAKNVVRFKYHSATY